MDIKSDVVQKFLGEVSRFRFISDGYPVGVYKVWCICKAYFQKRSLEIFKKYDLAFRRLDRIFILELPVLIFNENDNVSQLFVEILAKLYPNKNFGLSIFKVHAYLELKFSNDFSFGSCVCRSVEEIYGLLYDALNYFDFYSMDDLINVYPIVLLNRYIRSFVNGEFIILDKRFKLKKPIGLCVPLLPMELVGSCKIFDWDVCGCG